jgi:hypothetical protein
MDKSWLQEMLSLRSVHNRNARKFTSQATSPFNITRILGLYQLKCPKAHGLIRSSQCNRTLGKHQRNVKHRRHHADSPRLEIQRFTNEDDGLIGDLFLPGVLDASFVMAGSRKILQDVLARANISEDPDSEAESHKNPLEGKSTDNSDDEDEQHETCPGQQSSEILEHEDNRPTERQGYETTEELRSNNFEKNKFRQPKFWLS